MKKKLITGLLVTGLFITGCGSKPSKTKGEDVLTKTIGAETQLKDVATDVDEAAVQFALHIDRKFNGLFKVTASQKDKVITLDLMDKEVDSALKLAKAGSPTAIETSKGFLDGIRLLSKALYLEIPGYGIIMNDMQGYPIYVAYDGIEIANEILD